MNRAVAFGLMLGGPLAAFAAVSGDGSGLKLEGVTVNGEKVCEIGECVAMAKRKDVRWFLAVENGAEARKLDIGLGFLGAGRWYLSGLYSREGKKDEAKKLLDEIKAKYPDAVTHQGKKFADLIK